MTQNKEWQDLIPVNSLETGDVTPAQLGTHEFAVYDTIDGIFVSLARCTHGAANLCDGYFDGKYIECPLHQGLFDARTGEAKATPARKRLFMVESRVNEGMIQIKV